MGDVRCLTSVVIFNISDVVFDSNRVRAGLQEAIRMRLAISPEGAG